MVEFPKKFFKKRVEVTWYDIASGQGWFADTAHLTPLPITTVGWVSSIIKKKGLGESVTISASTGVADENREYNQHMSIPVSVITEVKAL